LISGFNKIVIFFAQINCMRKVSFALGLLLMSVIAIGQNFQQMQADAQKAMKSTTFGRDSTKGKFYTLRGFRMYCETYGAGQPLVIIHGNGGSIADFYNQIPYFAKKYNVIIADNRAQGKSVDGGDSLSYEMMADDYAELLNMMKIDSAYVIGWSDGGINGLLLAMRHPEKVKKLAVTGANLTPDTSAVNQDVIDLINPYYTQLKAKTTKTPQEKAGWKLMRLLIEEPHIAPASLHAIACPTLVIGGDHDILKPAHTLQIFQNIPQAYLWILPNSGHSTPIVYKDEFNKKVDDFFSAQYRKIAGEARFF
jgi:pimeloyl-ACP methyl ester carboxylesterase